MERFEIQPVSGSALPDVADFLQRWRQNEANGSAAQHRETAASIERRLRWLLLENPVASEDSPLGFCVRDTTGMVRGLNLAFPAAFQSAGQRLTALASACFFVEPEARSLGFYLFKKYLNRKDYAFFFATTCNAKSSELWSMVGGRPVPGSEIEHILPLRLDGVMPALVASKTASAFASGAARLLGRCANPFLRMLTPPPADLTIERCQDWEKLSELSRRHQSANHIASDRSLEFLQWRYGPTSPLSHCGIYLFRDKLGNEGWFSLGNLVRGEQGQFRGSVLVDAIWPREKMSFHGIFQEVVRLASDHADALFLRSQPGVRYREFSRWVVPYKLAAPRVFVKMQKDAAPLALDALDYDDSDYGAWRFQWNNSTAILQPVSSRLGSGV